MRQIGGHLITDSLNFAQLGATDQAVPLTVVDNGDGTFSLLVQAMPRSVKSVTGSQDLSISAASVSTSETSPFELLFVAVHASTSINETVTIRFISGDGSDYNTMIDSIDLSGTDLFWQPSNRLICKAGDQIQVEVTNANLTGTVYITIQIREV